MSTTKIDSQLTEPIKVNIYNQTYSLRSDGDGEYLKLLARIVDERMQAIASHTTVVDYARVAVLAALNIADELQRVKSVLQPEITTEGSANSEPAHDEDKGEDYSDAWSYENIFESLPSKRETSSRMSHQITNRLRQRKQESEPVSDRKPEPEK